MALNQNIHLKYPTSRTFKTISLAILLFGWINMTEILPSFPKINTKYNNTVIIIIKVRIYNRKFV